MNRLTRLVLPSPLRHSSLVAIASTPSPPLPPPRHAHAPPPASHVRAFAPAGARSFASGGMFESLTSSMGQTLKKLMGRKTVTAEEVEQALLAVNDALVDADVAQVTRHTHTPTPPAVPRHTPPPSFPPLQPVITSFMERVRRRAVGQQLVDNQCKTTTVLRVVHDEMLQLLGGSQPAAIAVGSGACSSYLVVGVQGSGKTTTCAKLAVMLQRAHYRSVLLVSLDNRRPAGQQQLQLLAQQWGVACLPIVPLQQPLDIVARAKEAARAHGHDCVVCVQPPPPTHLLSNINQRNTMLLA